MNWQGMGRTNYVRIEESNRELVERLAKIFSIRIVKDTEDTEDRWAFFPDETDNGDFVFAVLCREWGKDDRDTLIEAGYSEWDLTHNDVEWSWMNIARYMPDGEVLIVVEAGHEGERYIGYNEAAYDNKGSITQYCSGDILNTVEKLGYPRPTPPEY